MKKQTKILIALIATSIIVFTILNIYFPCDGYYYSIERSEQSYKEISSCQNIIVECPVDDMIYEVFVNDKNELYILQIKTRTLFGLKQYKVTQYKGYSMEKALSYYDQTLDAKWIDFPEINLNANNPIFSWSLIRNDGTLLSETSENIKVNGVDCILFYRIKTVS